MKKIPLTFLALFSIGNWLLAQSVIPVDVQNKYDRYIKPSSTADWIEFKQEAPFTGDLIFIDAPDLLGISLQDKMKLERSNTDPAGNKHYKYAQYHNNVRIEGVEIGVHERNGRVHLINGEAIRGLQVETTPYISSEQAIEIALENYPADVYLWQDAFSVERFKAKKGADATLYPTPELLIVRKDTKGAKHGDNYTLAWRMFIGAKQPYISTYVYIDAIHGTLLRARSADVMCNPTSVETTFNGAQTVNTDFRFEECGASYTDVNSYFSIDDCTAGTEIRSYYSAGYYAANYGDDYLLCDGDNSWTSTGSTKMVLSTLYATRKAVNYYLNVHGHESFDGESGLMDVFSNKTYFDDFDDPYCSNANFTSFLDNLYFGSGPDCSPGTMDDYNTLDIAGHEMTHGVIEYAHFDALDYSDESGALNESFADIFGEMVEYYTEGGTLSWLMAEDRGAIRSFSDPNDYGDPDTYFGTNWAPLGGDDNGGVHTNSNVQNHMFYLLSVGGSGTNDNGLPYEVEGIGYDHARDIAWSAMMNYLNAADGYVTARNAWIQAAIDLFGSCSQQVISVGQAWQAVGVTAATAYDLASVCGTYTLTGYADATYGIENATILLNDFWVNCATTINSPAVVTFESAGYIQMNPGFEAKSGSTFVAWIDPCEVSDYNPDDLRFDPDAQPSTEIPVTEADALNIYPVPASQQITVKFIPGSEGDFRLLITDISGKQVAPFIEYAATMDTEQMVTIDVHDLSAGVYFVMVQGDTYQQSAKFVVQH